MTVRNILLVEPDYRSKFPPLGLMRLATYHRERGDAVTFARGKNPRLKSQLWHRIYVSSLFTWELPRTVATLAYYSQSVANADDLFVGGVGVTLYPTYVSERVRCRILAGLVDKGGELDVGSPPLSTVVPDYEILTQVDYPYGPLDAYFVKITQGCVRKCSFCAVPKLEPKFAMSSSLKIQLGRVEVRHGPKQNLIVMDNNILGVPEFPSIVEEIRAAGFVAEARKNKRKRSVDFNQGLDCRLIDRSKARLLSSMCIDPVRLAFDMDGVEKPYRTAIEMLADNGLREFTNYLLFNFVDTPQSLYYRMCVNMDLNQRLGVAITAFPMRFVPMDDVNKRHISTKWPWRYLRGMQCVLLATRGLVSPNPSFFEHAFGSSFTQFSETLAMPDRYIVWRKAYRTRGADDWRSEYRKLTSDEQLEFLEILRLLNKSRERTKPLDKFPRYRNLLEHYYPGCKAPHNGPPEKDVDIQGVATGYDFSVKTPKDCRSAGKNRPSARAIRPTSTRTRRPPRSTSMD